MCLNELEINILNNKKYEIFVLIGSLIDKVRYKYYKEIEILNIVNQLTNINILSLDYDIREEILYLLVEITSYYNLQFNFNNILNIRNKLEEELQQYIDELIENIKNN